MEYIPDFLDIMEATASGYDFHGVDVIDCISVHSLLSPENMNNENEKDGKCDRKIDYHFAYYLLYEFE